MLRLLALALFLANGVYFFWAQGWGLPLGWGPIPQTEPQRLARQLHPEALSPMDAAAFKRIEAQAQAEREPKDCLQAGPLEPSQLPALRQTLNNSLPSDAWQLQEIAVAERWILYMGKYPSAEGVAKKRAEVAALSLPTEALENAALEPGFSVGAFASKAEADAALARLVAKGLHTARVVQERPASVVYRLRLPAVNAALKSKLDAVQNALGGKSLSACNEAVGLGH